ncbi:MAG: methyltransferase domain-containing protein, partial [Pyrinomonadaceae bacterium]
MTPAVQGWFTGHLEKLGGRVLEVGSYNVNGGLKNIIPHRVGIDMRAGPEVDVVCKAEDALSHFPAASFDAVVSAETLEHIEDWRGAVKAMWEIVKPQGWVLISMASARKRRHDYPNDYWRLEEKHIREI